MVCKLKIDIVTPKVAMSKHSMVDVAISKNTPWNAILTQNFNVVVVKSRSLHKFFREFIEITEDVLLSAYTDGECLSLTGDTIEPDGWDHKGFPSVLLVESI